MAQNDVLEKLEQIVAEDRRYRLEGYIFIMHGEELLGGVRDYGQHLFGPTAKMVFEHWGVRGTEDFGNIVFNLVSAGILSTSDTDSHEDFAGVYDFAEVFEKQYDWKIEEPL